MTIRKTLTVGLILLATGAHAASLLLAGSYGTAAGCAAHNGAKASGEATLISPGDVRFEGNVCSYVGVTDAPGADGARGWRVEIACESGHDEVIRGTLALIEGQDAATLSVALVDGSGPKGEFAACEEKAQ